MRREKGKGVEKWNWQAYESKYGPDSDISSEYDIISNYNFSDGSEGDEDCSMINRSLVRGRTHQAGSLKNRKTTKRSAFASEQGDF